jgi:hypothetical protein
VGPMESGLGFYSFSKLLVVLEAFGGSRSFPHIDFWMIFVAGREKGNLSSLICVESL